MNGEVRERLRLLERDHEPDGWPAVRMGDISAVLDNAVGGDGGGLRDGYTDDSHLDCEPCRSVGAGQNGRGKFKDACRCTTHGDGQFRFYERLVKCQS